MLYTGNYSTRGFALISAMLLVMLLAGISVLTVYLVQSQSRLMATDLDSTQSYYAAEAAMEKMIVDLSGLYTSQLAPTVADIQALGGDGYKPIIAGNTFPEYRYTVPNLDGEPITEVRAISAGPNAGLTAYIVPMTLGVTASGTG